MLSALMDEAQAPNDEWGVPLQSLRSNFNPTVGALTKDEDG
jgi:hypothetical protein